MKQVFSLLPLVRNGVDVDQRNCLQPSEEGSVQTEVIHKIDDAGVRSGVHITEMNPFRRRSLWEKQREFVDEVAEGLRLGIGCLVGLGWQVSEGNIQYLGKEVNLFLFGGHVFCRWIRKDIIENKKLGFDVINLVRSPVTQVWLVQATVDCLGSDMVHGGILVQRIGLAVLVGTKFFQERIDAFPTLDTGKLHEMPPEKDPGMQGHKSQEIGFNVAVAECFHVLDVGRTAVHNSGGVIGFGF